MFSSQKPENIRSDEKKLSDFESLSPKPGGTRWGFVGKLKTDTHGEYLIKREAGGYATASSKCENDCIVLECLSASLIRLILGDTFAAETQPVKLDCRQFNYHQKIKAIYPQTNDTIKLQPSIISYSEYANYGLSSKILRGTADTNKKTLPAEYELIKLSIVASLIGISDIKEEHLIHYYSNDGTYNQEHIALIDCAADFDEFSKKLDKLLMGKASIYSIKPNDYGIVLSIFSKFLEVDMNKSVDKYQHIPVSDLCTNSILKERLKKTVAAIEKFIPELENKIETLIDAGEIKLAKYSFNALFKLLISFPEKFRLPILRENQSILDQLLEEEYMNIRTLLSDKTPLLLSPLRKGEEKKFGL